MHAVNGIEQGGFVLFCLHGGIDIHVFKFVLLCKVDQNLIEILLTGGITEAVDVTFEFDPGVFSILFAQLKVGGTGTH